MMNVRQFGPCLAAAIATAWACAGCGDDTPATETAGDDAGPDASSGMETATLASEAAAREAITEICQVTGSSDGYLDEGSMRERALEYLRFSTEELRPATNNLIAHLARERMDDGYEAPTDAVAPDAWDDNFEKIDTLKDTSDFKVLDFLALLYAAEGHPIVSSDLYERVEQTLLDFKYWFKDKTVEGKRDDMWYWTENHLCGFHTAEYLAGQMFPDRVFATTGWTGAEHQERGRELLLEWFETVRRFGFKEFHSNVYYDVQLRPLLLLAEYAEDDDIATLAAMTIDLMLFDLALHNHRGSFGASHGRTYKKDKMWNRDENTFHVTKFLFDNTSLDYPGDSQGNVLLLATATRYRVPQVILDVASDDRPYVDRERMSVPIDEQGPMEDDPVAPYGLSFTDPGDLNLWWGMSAQTPWQITALSLGSMEEFNLWENESFAPFRPLMALVSNIDVARGLAHDNATLLNFAVLSEVNSYTFRTADYMLSSAQDRRAGYRSNQGHPWQATLGENAHVFVTHPGSPPLETDNWRQDGDAGQWTGTATLPRSGQYANLAIHLQSPKYGPDEVALFAALSTYEPYTHAFFPREHFDEVVHEVHDGDDQQGSWTFASLDDGYLALYSWRAAQFVDQPDGVPTGGFEQSYELRADGGADNVWIVELGNAEEFGSFEQFREAVLAASIDVTRREEAEEAIPVASGQIPRFFDEVVYESPSQGRVTFGHDAPLVVNGDEVPLSEYRRYDNPWSRTEFDAERYQITSGCNDTGIQLDFAGPTRTVW